MAKFKIGDSVRIIKVTPADINLGINLDSIGIVREILNDNSCLIEFLGKYFYMTNDQLEKIISRNDAVDALNYAIQYWADFNQIKEKEKNNMELLDLWKERQFFKIENDYQLEKQKIIKEDEAQRIMQEMLNQINVVLDRNEENEFKLKCDDLLTKTTKQKINELEVNKDFSKDKIFDTYQEVKAMLSMTNDYSEQMKILKNYGIIDKKTNKLNV